MKRKSLKNKTHFKRKLLKKLWIKAMMPSGVHTF